MFDEFVHLDKLWLTFFINILNRWLHNLLFFLCFTGILLQEEKINSVFLLYLMSIPSFCILAVAALALENWALLESPLHYDRRLWVFILLSCLGSVMYNLASCCVITLTSAVTLHILGNLNVVGNLLLSQLLFGSELSALSCLGAVLTLSGMLIYQNSEFIVDFMDARRSKAAERADFHTAACEEKEAEASDQTHHSWGADVKQEKTDWASIKTLSDTVIRAFFPLGRGFHPLFFLVPIYFTAGDSMKILCL